MCTVIPFLFGSFIIFYILFYHHFLLLSLCSCPAGECDGGSSRTLLCSCSAYIQLLLPDTHLWRGGQGSLPPPRQSSSGNQCTCTCTDTRTHKYLNALPQKNPLINSCRTSLYLTCATLRKQFLQRERPFCSMIRSNTRLIPEEVLI